MYNDNPNYNKVLVLIYSNIREIKVAYDFSLLYFWTLQSQDDYLDSLLMTL
jgi:hypothetical protein